MMTGLSSLDYLIDRGAHGSKMFLSELRNNGHQFSKAATELAFTTSKAGNEVVDIGRLTDESMAPYGGFLRLAGISGAIAIYLGAYGSHHLKKYNASQYHRDTFEIASYYHFVHTLALMGVPMTRRPICSGIILTSGMFVFCGSCYYHALSGDDSLRPVTPYGAFLLVLGWLSMAF